MKYLAAIAVCCFVSTAFAEPATAPATETLLKGDIVFTPPDGWTREGGSSDGRRVGYTFASPKSVLVVNADPQQFVLDPSHAAKIGQDLVKRAKENAAKQGFEFVSQPKAEKDDRFFLRIHQKYKRPDGETGDQLQIYRVVGVNLVAVATTAFTENPDESKKIFDDAEKTLLTVRSSKQPAPGSTTKPKTHPTTRPTALPNAKIAVAAPFGWTAETNDNASGIVATYKDPDQSFNTIIVSVRPLPPEAKKDPKIRDALVDEIAKGQKTEFQFEGAQPVGDAEKIPDRRFLRKERIRYEKSEYKIQVTARQLRIGDAVVSVAMASMEQSAADNDRLADEVALKIQPAGK